MSGFENMKSRVNEFLHPSVDSTDRYDPTFLGLSHKKRPAGHSSPCSSLGGTLGGASGLTSPFPTARVTALNSNMNLNSSELVAGPNQQQDQWLLHRGKRPDPFGPRHDPSVFTQDERMVQPFDNKGNLTEVRFGKGFNRRGHSAIGAEKPRIEADAAREVVAEERQQLVRQRHADRERPLNPLTWAQTTTSIAYDTINSRATNYVEFNRTAQSLSSGGSLSVAGTVLVSSDNANTNTNTSGAAEAVKRQLPLQPALYPSSTAADKVQSKRTFSDRYATTVGPPTSAPSSTNASSSLSKTAVIDGSGQHLSVRVQRFRAEGLLKPKEWGVAQQMKCGDGYVLPEIVPTAAQKASKRQVRPQTVSDTRPW